MLRSNVEDGDRSTSAIDVALNIHGADYTRRSTTR